jgi:hypothetical protein
MKTFQFHAAYYAGTMGQVDLPIDNWDEIDSWYVKWDTLFYCLKSDPDKVHEVNLNSDTMDIIDWKRPMSVDVQLVDDDGNMIETVDVYE